MRARLPRLRSKLVASLFASVLGCVGGSLTTTATQPSPAAAPDAFSCVRDELKKAGFSQTAYDADRLWVSARRFDENQRRPDTQFRRMVDRLTIEVAPGTGEALSTITAEASTFAELATQRGPTEVQEKASETARGAAQTILRNCSRSADSLAVPQAEPERP
jgi:hypothetical protein